MVLCVSRRFLLAWLPSVMCVESCHQMIVTIEAPKIKLGLSWSQNSLSENIVSFCICVRILFQTRFQWYLVWSCWGENQQPSLASNCWRLLMFTKRNLIVAHDQIGLVQFATSFFLSWWLIKECKWNLHQSSKTELWEFYRNYLESAVLQRHYKHTGIAKLVEENLEAV